MHDRLLAAIETLYDCIGDDFDHARALEAYSRTADDTGFMLVEIRPLLGGFATYHAHNIPADAVSAMIKKHDSASTNPLIRDLGMLPERTPVLRRAVSPDDEFRKTAQYRNTCEPWGLHSDGVALFKKGLITTTVCGFCRRPGQSEIDQGLLGLMAVMNTHYCRAMTLQKTIGQAGRGFDPVEQHTGPNRIRPCSVWHRPGTALCECGGAKDTRCRRRATSDKK